MPFPCQKGSMGVEMRVLARISQSFCSRTRFGLNHTHYNKKGGENSPPKDFKYYGLECWRWAVVGSNC